ncbi:MAG: hypothetical protein WCX48_12340, partial [Bacteroidales bacterium]
MIVSNGEDEVPSLVDRTLPFVNDTMDLSYDEKDYYMLLLNEPLYTIGWNERPSVENFCYCHLLLNSMSFGLASRTDWEFWVCYDPIHGHWNFEKPKLPTYYATPRSVLSGATCLDGEMIPAPPMRCGYRSEEMRQYDNKEFPLGYYKCPWDYPCREDSDDYMIVHPEYDRLLTTAERNLIFGSPKGEVPKPILEYLIKHATYYMNKSWGTQNFDARYEKF